MNVYHNRIHIKTIELMSGQNPPKIQNLIHKSVYCNGVHRIRQSCCRDKIPPGQNPPKIQNLIYMSVYRNGVHRIWQICCWNKIPPGQNPQKIQNLIYMCVYRNGVHRIWYRGSPLSTNLLSTIPGIVRFEIVLKSMDSPVQYAFYQFHPNFDKIFWCFDQVQ